MSQRIANSTRQGSKQSLQLERFSEALEDPESSLTYPALTGQHKQSVRDAERLLSEQMVKFMQKKGYSSEAEYIERVLNWRRSSDERGLTQLQRSRYNYQILMYLLDDLIPWHRNYDFSTLEVKGGIKPKNGKKCKHIFLVQTNETSMKKSDFNFQLNSRLYYEPIAIFIHPSLPRNH